MDTNNCYNEEGKCIKCPVCNCDYIQDVIVDTMDFTIMEKKQVCSQCVSFVGYWATGYYDPEYSMDYVRNQERKNRNTMRMVLWLAITSSIFITLTYINI